MRHSVGDENWKSAVVVPVPECEYLVGPWRARFTPSGALGVPAHATVLHPFHAPVDLDDAVPALAELARSQAPFEFTLARCARFDGGILYLEPEPAAPLVELMEDAQRRFPQFPRYGEPAREPVPHVTVASGGEPALLDRIETLLAPSLPLRARALDLWLVERRAEGWAVRNRLPLGAGR